MWREALKKLLLSRGMVISRPPGQFDLLFVKLADHKRRGLDLRCVVDGGAANGHWTRQLRELYPNATVICIEPRPDAQSELQQLARELPNIHIAPVLLGPNHGNIEFHIDSVHSSALPNSQGRAFGETRTVEMTTLDDLVAKLKLPWPDLIKLDLQGFEMEALKGAAQCMEHTQALLLELSLYEFQKGCPLADEVISNLRERKFRIYDIPNLSHRPLDGALGQMDFLFLRNGHPLLADNRYSTDSEFS
jgi:FkbM family methyltransferase